MNSLLQFFFITILVFLQSCDSTKKAAHLDSVNSNLKPTKMVNEKLITQGFSIGTLEYQKNGDCSYTITEEKTNFKYDPINITDIKYDAYKNKSSKIYFKFRRLRRANRCDNIQVIELIDIQERD